MAMTLGGLFNRFPKLKVASIEVGAAWVGYCLHELDHAGSNLVERRVTTFDGELVGRPSDVFKQHCYVAPFPEEDVVDLAGLIGADRVLFGSDWPHPEGVARAWRFPQVRRRHERRGAEDDHARQRAFPGRTGLSRRNLRDRGGGEGRGGVGSMADRSDPGRALRRRDHSATPLEWPDLDRWSHSHIDGLQESLSIWVSRSARTSTSST